MHPRAHAAWTEPVVRLTCSPSDGARWAHFFLSVLTKSTFMANEELLEMNGVVNETLPDARYRVTLDNGHTLVTYTAGKCGSTTSESSPETAWPRVI